MLSRSFKTIVASVALAFLSADAQATLVIDVGDHVLFADTPNQAVDVLVSSDPGDPVVSGIELHAQIGDGIGPGIEPVFNGVPGTGSGFDFSGSIFATASPSGTGPITGAPSLVDGGAALFSGPIGGGFTASGTLVTLLIDTTGFSTPGTVFDLLLTDITPPFPTSTQLLGPIGNSAPLGGVVINNGTLTIAAIPEPGMVTRFALVGLLGLVGRRRKR